MTPEIKNRLQKIRLAIFDVDGVLTDGRLHYGPNGEELKIFHVHDGLGLKQLMRSGITVAIISGRDCKALRARLADLGIEHAYLGQNNKQIALEDLLKKTGIDLANACHTGDDLPDLVVMQQTGFAFAPANAVREIRDHADWICAHSGGHGAVREICDLIIASGRQGESSQ